MQPGERWEGRLPFPCHQVQAAGKPSMAGWWESRVREHCESNKTHIPLSHTTFGSTSYLKGEGVRVVSGLLQQGLVHGAQAGLVALRVELDAVQPDVLPEAQAHHIQVIATVAEGTRQLHEH